MTQSDLRKETVTPLLALRAVPAKKAPRAVDAAQLRALEAALEQLGSEDAQALVKLGTEHARLRRLGRFVNVLPLSFLVLYPIVLPWLLWTAWQGLRQGRRRALQDLWYRHGGARTQSLALGATRLENCTNPRLRGYYSLGQLKWGLGLALGGPWVIVVGAMSLWWLLGA